MSQTNPSFTLFHTADLKARTLQGFFTIEYFVPFELQVGAMLKRVGAGRVGAWRPRRHPSLGPLCHARSHGCPGPTPSSPCHLSSRNMAAVPQHPPHTRGFPPIPSSAGAVHLVLPRLQSLLPPVLPHPLTTPHPPVPQDEPPQPVTPEIGVLRVEQQDVWVQSFGGFASEDDVVNKVSRVRARW